MLIGRRAGLYTECRSEQFCSGYKYETREKRKRPCIGKFVKCDVSKSPILNIIDRERCISRSRYRRQPNERGEEGEVAVRHPVYGASS